MRWICAHGHLLFLAIGMCACGTSEVRVDAPIFPSPCDCGENSVCDFGRCECPPGLAGNAAIACIIDSPCTGLSCGTFAHCEDAVCVCDLGSSGDPLTACSSGDPCDGVVCDDNATCVRGVCICNPGYAGDGAVLCNKNSCVTDVTSCELHTTCVDEHCVCDEDYVGDATLGCVPESHCVGARVSPASISFGPGGGTGLVSITAPDGCDWSIHKGAWIEILSDYPGHGNGTVVYAVAANLQIQARGIEISIADKIITATQAGVPCEYAVVADLVRLPNAGGISHLGVNTAPGCPWLASSDVAWMTVSFGESGRGENTIELTVQRNESPRQRAGVVRVADQELVLVQEGSLPPPSVPAGLQATASTCSTVDLSWRAAFASGGSSVSGYKVYRDGKFIIKSTILVATDSELNARDTHAYTVSAVDTEGRESLTSTPVTVELPSCPDNDPPSIEIIFPTADAQLSGVVTLIAQADDGPEGTGIAWVEFFANDAVLLGTVMEPPFSLDWDTTSESNGRRQIFCSAYDGAGNHAESTYVSVVIDNPPP
ncbi:MAG: hypothetical protein A2289_10510 [Deltaproteobacteria bacterium RIFOXYA12_FULL_58_15]|nr:MAG: hypothetical protein A2289_10510 [Deltaproteobacteria bacterium RIFOXYA12_FULL_58_15]